MLLGVVATAGFALIGPGDLRLASVLFVLAMIGATTSFVFYESLLPRLAGPADVDRVSSAGYALGYIGGGILLAGCLAAIQFPQAVGLGAGGRGLATRLSFVATAVWWLVFAIPLFRRVPEPPRLVERDESLRENPARAAFARLRETFRSLRDFRQAFLLLAAFLIYNDGIQTIIRMATAYGAEIGIPDTRDDARDPHRAVRRRALCLPLRRAGRPHRRQAGDPARPRGLRADQHRGLPHAYRQASSSCWQRWWAWCRAAPRR